MGVLLQAFYWDAPALEGCEAGWWNRVRGQIDELAADGFTALWLPPASKAAEWNSMGYDPYDYFDLGEFDQKGRVETYFGSRKDLESLVTEAHGKNLQVYADVVISHNSGADAQELNALSDQMVWTKFAPASGKFPRDWTCFHPSTYETMDEWPGFGGMPHLCHRHPGVYGAIMEYTRLLFEEIGFDGFRFDYVKGYGPWQVAAIAEYRFRRNGQFVKPFCVGECWDSDRTIEDWMGSVNNSFMDNPVCAFDFPLHYNLKGLCDSYGYDLSGLTAGALVADVPDRAVTFVDNHDTVRDPNNSVTNDKLLAYAVILTHQGYPCVFWQDYYNFGLAGRGTPNGIAALVQVHEQYAAGAAQVLHADHDLYILERAGEGNKPGLIVVVNNRGDRWNGAEVTTGWLNTNLRPVAWWSASDLDQPEQKTTDANGLAELWAAPRGYAVYVRLNAALL